MLLLWGYETLRCCHEGNQNALFVLSTMGEKGAHLHCLCMVANFGRFETVAISRILAVFWTPFFAQNVSNVVVESFFACFLEF